MIPMPATEKTGLRSLPWVCLGVFLAYFIIHLTLQHDELERQQDMADWYQQSGLFELEWENYISWLRISGQVAKAESLSQARADGDRITVFRAMAFDPAFERENQLRGDQYWDYEQVAKWRQMRDTFRERAADLPSVKAGLNPSAPRPSTYLTWHFLHENLWIWLVAMLVAMPFMWPVEAELGHRKTAALWIISGVISGLLYVVLLSSQYQPLTGSTPMAAALIGMYLGLFRLQKLDFLWFDPRQKKIRSTALPAAIIAPFFFILPLYEIFAGGAASYVWVAQIGALLAGAGLANLARQAEVRGAEQQTEEVDDSDRQLRQTLTSAWASMSALAFIDAEQQFEAAMKLDEKQFLPLTGLYNIRKLKPESEKFQQTAMQLFDADISAEDELRQQFNIYRDYLKRDLQRVNSEAQKSDKEVNSETQIPLAARVRLISHFSKLGETKEADQLALKIEKQGERHPMLAKSLSQLAQAMQSHNQTRSAQIKILVVRLAEEGV